MIVKNELSVSPKETSPVSKEKILLALMPFWTPLIPPLGISCLKSYLQKNGYPVTTKDLNIEGEFKQKYDEYFNVLKAFVPPAKRANFFNSGHEVLQNHMMAWMHYSNEKEYFELIKLLVYRCFYVNLDEQGVFKLHTILTQFYKELENYFLNLLEREKPAVLGLSVYSHTLAASMFVFKLAKTTYPQIMTFMGGAVFSQELEMGSPNFSRFLEKTPYIDKIIVGEGEALFLSLLRGELPGSKRVYTLKDLDNNPLDISSLGIPDFSDFNLRYYIYKAAYTSRSCPFQCKFCAETIYWGKYRKKTAQQVLQELQQLEEITHSQLYLMCDSLLNPIAPDLANEIIHSASSIYWDGYLRVDNHTMDPHATMSWRRGGLYRARLGVESGSQRVLDLMEKRVTVEQIKKSVKSLAQAGIKTTTYWIVGYPGETEADFRQTLDLLAELKDHIYEAECNHFSYFVSGQVDSAGFAREHQVESLYPEAANDMLIVQHWILKQGPTREETLKRINRFDQHCKQLGIPNPYTLQEIYNADNRWKGLHRHAVPPIIEFTKKNYTVNELKSLENLPGDGVSIGAPLDRIRENTPIPTPIRDEKRKGPDTDIDLSGEMTVIASQYEKEGKYWLNLLSGKLEKIGFPYDFKPQPAVKRSHDNDSFTHEITFELPHDLFLKLLKLSNDSDYRLYLILLAGLYLLLSKYSGQNDIIIGSPVFKQEIEEKFINTILILRNQVEPNSTFKDLLLEVRKTVIDAVNHVNYPLQMLLYQLDLPFSVDDFPLFDVVLLLENIQDRKYLHPLRPPMIFSFLKSDRGLRGRIEYNRLLYSESTLERNADHLQRLLGKALLDVNSRLKELQFLSDREKKQLIYDFNGTGSEYPEDKTIYELFVAQVEKQPDHMALVEGEHYLGYRELNHRANRLAHLLRKKGVEPDTLVGIMLERSIPLVIGILAILKAGGAYLPIDGESPTKRVISLLKDARVAILLSDSEGVKSHSFLDLQGDSLSGFSPYITTPREQISTFDALPFPDRSLVDYEKYNLYLGQAAVKDSISIQATRGCPYLCAYCHKIWPKNHVRRSVENIFAEVQLFYNMGVRRFAIIDDIFNLNMKESQRFFELIIENRLHIHIFFPNGLRGDILSREYIDLMIKAGTINIGFALETASPRLQKLIRKNLDIENLRNNIEYITKKYPHVIIDLFTMHGFPSETEEEACMTLDFIKSLKWIHFPYIFILKIYPNSDMEKLALAHGISQEAIMSSQDLQYQELPATLPFNKSFTLRYQAEFTTEYFLSKERLLYVLPRQIKFLTENELIRKYNTYLPVEINCFDDLLEFLGISRHELNREGLLGDQDMLVPDLNQKMKKAFGERKSSKNATRVLLMDLTQNFSQDSERFGDLVEPPLGLMYLMTYLNQQLGSRVKGKIVKSMIDFDNYLELKILLDEFKPDIIGIRTLTFYKNFFHKTVAMIRQWGIEVPIISGGPYATSSYKTLLRDRNIDLVVLGEGELTFADLVERIMQNHNKLPGKEVLKEVKGIAFIPEISSHRIGKWDILLMDGLSSYLTEGPYQDPVSISHAHNLAYTIFTSGSTGVPKGVLIDHRSLVNYTHWAVKTYMGKKGNNPVYFPFYTSIAFDLTVTSLFVPLITGNTVILYGEEYKGLTVTKVMDHPTLGVIKLTPSHMKMIREKNRFYSNIRCLIAGGEELETRLASDLGAHFNPDTDIFNEYGPTETTVGCMIHRFDSQRDTGRTVPIGIPADNVQIYILDQNLDPLPLGSIGEIYISGDGIARGYLNQPEITRKKFMTNPFIPGKKMYRSGDLGKRLPDGTIEFFGRIDQQIKIKGYRIELGEIESKLLAHKGIKETVVTARENNEASDHEKYLIAYWVPKEDAISLDILEVKDYLARELPGYLLPTHFVKLEKIPLTAHGKVDFKALPEGESLSSKENYEAPRNEIEKKIAEVWQEVLKVDRVGIHDNFFELGGDSLKSIRIESRLKKLNIDVTIDKFFIHQTIDRISSSMTRDTHEETRGREYFEDIENYLLEKQGFRSRMKMYTLDSISYRVLYIFQDNHRPDRNYHDVFIALNKAGYSSRSPHFIKLIASEAEMLSSKGQNEPLDYKLFSCYLGLQSTVLREGEKKILKGINEAHLLSLLLKKNKAVNEYGVSPVQRVFLLQPHQVTAKINQLFFFDFDFPIGIAGIKDLVTKIIDANTLLKSVIIEIQGNSTRDFLIREYDSFSNIEIPLLDLSGYTRLCQEKIMKTLYQKLYEPLDLFDQVLYRLAFFKLNESHYRLIFSFNHLIYDGESHRVLRDSIQQMLRSPLEKTRYPDTDNRQRYFDYIDFLNHSDYHDVELGKFLNLDHYMENGQKLSQVFKIKALEYDDLELDLSVLREEGKDLYNEIILLSFAGMIRDFSGMDTVSLQFMSTGRTYKDRNFNHIIGNFPDVIPVLLAFNGNSNTLGFIENFINYREYIRENNLNFLNFFLKNPTLRSKYSKFTLSPFIFNSLLGHYGSFKDLYKDEHIRERLVQEVRTPYFEMFMSKDLHSEKLFLYYVHNSGVENSQLKELFLKNYYDLVNNLNENDTFPVKQNRKPKGANHENEKNLYLDKHHDLFNYPVFLHSRRSPRSRNPKGRGG